ncbi:phosphate ABC transporter substrate-binding protein [Shewanella sp. WXL01]|uniref:Phosphate ABC transporter substrate-binding protein n=1 Tax=Shewanella maritima TaxID=2520507 RepID=A0A411PLN1_9GAMM|nr:MULTISPECIES: phosphate ABC transporter substrate-binding protein [Shewanella]NKF51635.1 phosphate ABC transporter substrate-binding protein [Shewanella sp. WXL01]QBF84450.1 phosphate ABC transporter substrate-binding protein [Shewanella maritima]
MKKLFSTLALSLTCIASAHAGVVVIGNTGTTDISKGDAKKAFLGKGSSYVVYELDEGNATRSEFHGAVTGKSDAQLKAYWSKQVFTGKGNPPATVSDAAAMKAAVASDANAIGYIDEADLDSSVKVIFKP